MYSVWSDLALALSCDNSRDHLDHNHVHLSFAFSWRQRLSDRRMTSNLPVNFYGRNPTVGARGRVQDPLATLDKKLDGIFGILTEQNHQMVTLQDQGEQTLQQIGSLDGRLGALEERVRDLEKSYTQSSESDSKSSRKKSRLPPELCVCLSLWLQSCSWHTFHCRMMLNFCIPTFSLSTSLIHPPRKFLGMD